MLIDKFLEDAIEVDVDASATAKTYVIGGIMEHIEGPACTRATAPAPAAEIASARTIQDEIRRHTIALAKELKVAA